MNMHGSVALPGRQQLEYTERGGVQHIKMALAAWNRFVLSFNTTHVEELARYLYRDYERRQQRMMGTIRIQSMRSQFFASVNDPRSLPLAMAKDE